MTCLGLMWFALAVVEEGSTTLRIALGIVWTALGLGYLIVAAHDRVRSEGAYATPSAR